MLIVLFVPETYSPVLLRRKAILLRRETGDDRVSRTRNSFLIGNPIDTS